MAMITLRVLDGADRGRVFGGLPTPVTIGREEGNVVQLNDERVSRYHLKIQEDQQQYVLTDLDSTNGTKVNGEDVSLRILRFGDIISVGRSVVLFGSREEIAERLIGMQSDAGPQAHLPAGSGLLAYSPRSAMTTLATIYRRAADVRYRVLDDEAVVIRQRAGEVLGLNSLGARLLDALDGAATVGEIVADLAPDYDVERGELERDALEFYAELATLGLVEEQSASAEPAR